MPASTILSENFVRSSPRSQLRPTRGGKSLNAFAKPCAAAILLATLLAPACCLNGAHAHGGDIDGFGPICFSRVGSQ
jgi:hypothetical protein